MRTKKTAVKKASNCGRNKPIPSPELRVFGSPIAVRQKLLRQVQRGSDLLGQLEGARARLAVTKRGGEASLAGFMIVEESYPAIRSWARASRRMLETHVGSSEAQGFPIISRQHNHTHATELDQFSVFVKNRILGLQELCDRIRVRRNVDRVAPLGIRLDELRDSNLVDIDLLSNLEAKMKLSMTPRNLRDAIGAAKEVTEATLRAVLELTESITVEGIWNLPQLAKAVRDSLRRRAAEVAPSAGEYDGVDRLQAGLANIIQTLAEIRNEHGSGHGRPRLAKGLRPRHARLAIDAAELYVRFLVTTIDDLKLLPAQLNSTSRPKA